MFSELFAAAKNAKLKTIDLAALLGVSRPTISMWLNGHAEPHHLHANKVVKILDAVRLALEAGDLPTPKGLSAPERLDYLRNVVATHIA